MGAKASKGGLALRGADTLLRILQFLCAGLLLGIFSYFLAYLHSHHQHIPTWMRACEGISGAAVIYTAFATILTCFLGGITFFAFLAILLDVAFLGAFIAIVILAKGGRHTSGANSPLGNRKARDAKLQTAAFAVAIIGAFLFLLTAFLAVALNRQHKKEKKYGPSPANNYTSGKGRRSFFERKRNPKATHDSAELGIVGAGSAVIAEEKARHGGHHTNGAHATNGTHATNGAGAMAPTTTAPDESYGGPVGRYNEAPVQQPTSGYNAYTPQTTGTTSDAGYTTTTTSTNYGASPHTTVIHDPNPYAPVHGSGVPHREYA